jgi:hypothetical protein
MKMSTFVYSRLQKVLSTFSNVVTAQKQIYSDRLAHQVLIFIYAAYFLKIRIRDAR